MTLHPGAQNSYFSPRAHLPRVSALVLLALLGLLSSRARADGPYTWVASSWTTAAGTASCTESAPQTRIVGCQDAGGDVADPSLCDQAEQPPSSQYVTDYTSCTYLWATSDWTPAAGAACTNALTQTRTITCERSDGTAADASFCASSGLAPPASETIIDTGACTYSWTGGGFSACQDSTDAAHPSWLYTYSSFTPVLGCGATTQTRLSSCSAVANSGTQSQTVTCQRSDGTTADGSLCAGLSPPATTRSCTPGSSETPNCDVTSQGVLERTVVLTSGCAGTGQTVSGGTAPPSGVIQLPAAPSGYQPQSPACLPDASGNMHCMCVPDAAHNIYCIYFNLSNVTS